MEQENPQEENEQNQENSPNNSAEDNLKNKRGTCKKGFFVLRECKKSAVAKCALSKRYICEDCAVEWEGKVVCAEELVKYLKKQGIKPDTTQNSVRRWQSSNNPQPYYYDTYNDYTIWYYAMRDDFYIQENYQPFTDFDSAGFGDSGAEFGGGEFSGAGATASWEEEGENGDFYDS